MTKKYLVKLIPHDKFFFGGETTFGEGNVNYFVKSNYYPQQTSLLGLVRYQLLLQSKETIFNNNTIVNKTEAAKLIGYESYKLDGGFNFGVIKNLSTVFITDSNGNNLFSANKEYQWYRDKNGNEIKEMRQIYFNDSGNCSLHKLKIPELLKYEVKEGLPDLLIDKSLTLYKYSEIFKEHKQVGIRKNYEGKSEDKAYYIQVYYKLLKSYSFAFTVELDDSVRFESQSIVVLGGEQSKFKMDVKEFKTEFDSLVPDYQESVESPKVVLVSDAYVENGIFDDCDFAITETVDFRSIKSSVNDTINYAAMSGVKKDALRKSDKFNFFKRGSVFFGDTNTISKKLNNDSLQKIGYNIYKPIIKS